MAVGFGLLRLAPTAFWAMTPIEFSAALSLISGAGAPPAAGDLEALMRQFPDHAPPTRRESDA